MEQTRVNMVGSGNIYKNERSKRKLEPEEDFTKTNEKERKLVDKYDEGSAK